MTRVVTWPSNLLGLLSVYGLDGLSGKTSQGFCLLTEDGLLKRSSGRWLNAGMGSPTEFLTLSSMPWHNGGSVSSLSDILETGDHAAAVLFERESLRRDTAPGRKAGQEVAGTIGGRTGEGGPRQDLDYIPIQEGQMGRGKQNGAGVGIDGDPMYTLQSGKQHGIAMCLSAAGFDGSEDGTGRGSPLVIHGAQITSKANRSQPHDQAPALNGDPRLICFDSKQSGNDAGELSPTLRATPHDKSHANGGGERL